MGTGAAGTLLGEHNRSERAGGDRRSRATQVSPPAAAIEALGRFRGVKRRHGGASARSNGVTVYDDFAHHPTAIAARRIGGPAPQAYRAARRIVAVLEPRSNTMKLGVWKESLAASLADADRAYCYTDGLGWDAGAALAPLGAKSEAHDDVGRLAAAIARAARPGDHVLVMSNGGFAGLHGKLLAALEEAHG